MDLKQAVARLNRAGNENPAYQRKLSEATREIGKFLHDIFPTERVITLPKEYCFKHSDATWTLLKEETESGKVIVYFAGQFAVKEEWSFDLSHLLKFAKDINEGWLDEVSQFLEGQNSSLSSATISIRARIFLSARGGYVPGSGTLFQDLQWLIKRATEAGENNYEGWRNSVPHLKAAAKVVQEGADFPG